MKKLPSLQKFRYQNRHYRRCLVYLWLLVAQSGRLEMQILGQAMTPGQRNVWLRVERLNF
jgi:hypothetical protein